MSLVTNYINSCCVNVHYCTNDSLSNYFILCNCYESYIQKHSYVSLD